MNWAEFFYNVGMDIRHNPEFLSVEIYQAYDDYCDLIEVTKGIVCAVGKAFFAANFHIDK